MRSIGKDIQFALRTFRKSPVFTVVALLSLALGIGANTAIFSLLDQVLLRAMPVKNPQELVLFHMNGFHYGSNWGDNALSYPMYRDFKGNNSVFTGMFCRWGTDFSLGFSGTTERVSGELVSGTYSRLLGVGAAVGRTFTPDDDRSSRRPSGGDAELCVISGGNRARSETRLIIWQDGGGERTMDFTVIGVAEKGFDGVDLGAPSRIFVPLMMRPALMPLLNEELDFNNRRTRWVNVFGRLKPGVSRQRAQASLQPYFHSMLELEVKEAAFNKASAEVRARFLRNVIETLPGAQGKPRFRDMLSTPLWVLMALTGGVLLIACANVASLLIARAASRQKEIAIRLAIGAGRFRIIRQLLVESVLLSVAGGILGLLLAIWSGPRGALVGIPAPETATTLKLVHYSRFADPPIRRCRVAVHGPDFRAGAGAAIH